MDEDSMDADLIAALRTRDLSVTTAFEEGMIVRRTPSESEMMMSIFGSPLREVWSFSASMFAIFSAYTRNTFLTG